jgi:hypothetical protein
VRGADRAASAGTDLGVAAGGHSHRAEQAAHRVLRHRVPFAGDGVPSGRDPGGAGEPREQRRVAARGAQAFLRQQQHGAGGEGDGRRPVAVGIGAVGQQAPAPTRPGLRQGERQVVAPGVQRDGAAVPGRVQHGDERAAAGIGPVLAAHRRRILAQPGDVGDAVRIGLAGQWRVVGQRGMRAARCDQGRGGRARRPASIPSPVDQEIALSCA